jgi:acetate kinase
MNILVFNCGSSSLKYRLIEMPSERELAGGEVQRIGPPTAQPSRILYSVDGKKNTLVVPMRDHAEASAQVIALLSAGRDLRPDAIAHRFVHGGRQFAHHVRINPADLAKLELVAGLAPIHNPPAIRLVKSCMDRYPLLPQVIVFDTAFHSSIPPAARTYAIPADLRRKLGLRKYGFHGTSHQYVAEESARLLGCPMNRLNAVSCHLGSGGASLCAIRSGRSIDNTMGFSPLQGLVMSTRCGDLDPAVALQLLTTAGGKHQAVESLLNNKCGVLGLTGRSSDIRDALAGSGEAPAADRTAAQVYLWRIRKYLGAYLAAVGKARAIIFTDTIGETVPEVRSAICSGLEAMGVKIDAGRNLAAGALPADIASDDSPIRILVVATNEELAIARHTHRILAA